MRRVHRSSEKRGRDCVCTEDEEVTGRLRQHIKVVKKELGNEIHDVVSGYMPAHLENRNMARPLETIICRGLIPMPKRRKFCPCQNYRTMSLTSHSNKIMFRVVLN